MKITVDITVHYTLHYTMPLVYVED